VVDDMNGHGGHGQTVSDEPGRCTGKHWTSTYGDKVTSQKGQTAGFADERAGAPGRR
jgi:hypothetical protein